MRILRLPGVFRPRSDTWILADALAAESLPCDPRILEVCAGSGAVAVVAAAKVGGHVTAVDISRRAVASVRLNARRHGVRVKARRSDLFDAVAGERFDAVVSNPPYLPAKDDRLPRGGARRAWDAGRDGRAVLDRLCAGASAHLKPGGVLLVVHSSVCDEGRTLELMAARGLEAAIVARRHGPLGPLLGDRAEMLEARGLLARGEREEDVVVVRGRLPVQSAASEPPEEPSPSSPLGDDVKRSG